jgi:UDP-galactopyranose mutase
MNILAVGAGFAGATAARLLAEAGHKVLVIDKRDHIAGNAYDYTNEHGIRVHRYGPHLWHTSNDEVQEWASRFTEWVPYQHWVRADWNGVDVPLPINRETIEKVFGARFDDWADENNCISWGVDGEMLGYMDGAHAAFLETLVEHHLVVTNSRQHIENSVGKELCDIFFAPYTRKMWGLDLEDLPSSVAARIPTNVESNSHLYFPKDKHQFLPKDGYTQMVRSILDHPNIEVLLERSREEMQDSGVKWDHIFTSEPIDTFFDCRLGELPWRSIKLHTHTVPLQSALPSPVLNFTHSGPHTRVTEWKKLPGHGSNPHFTTLTFEEPCDYRDNGMERYYPVKSSQEVCPHRELYKKYRDLADKTAGLTFIGRCGLWTYTDMSPCISSTMSIVKKFLQKNEAV